MVNKTIKPYKILYLTSDKVFLKTLDNIFERNIQFIQALPEDNLVKKAYDKQPDLILKDIINRNNYSFHTFKALKQDKNTQNIPIIVVSEKQKPRNIDEFFNAGISEYISKHFSPTEISARIRTHLEFKRNVEENIELQLLKSKFFSVMTNDIKDSLIGVKGIAKFLVQDLENEKSERNTNETIKMAKILLNDSEELYMFLENVIQWASVETSKGKIKPEKFHFHELVSQNLYYFDKDVNLKNVRIVRDYKQDVELITEKSSLHVVLLHLISNAIKYSHKDGEVIISAKESNDGLYTKIVVEDKGIGMEKDVVKNIFRLDTPYPKTVGTKGEKGTDLGLITCRSIIEKIYGDIFIESKKGQGTKVNVVIPKLKII